MTPDWVWLKPIAAAAAAAAAAAEWGCYSVAAAGISLQWGWEGTHRHPPLLILHLFVGRCPPEIGKDKRVLCFFSGWPLRQLIGINMAYMLHYRTAARL